MRKCWTLEELVESILIRDGGEERGEGGGGVVGRNVWIHNVVNIYFVHHSFAQCQIGQSCRPSVDSTRSPA